MEVVCKKMVKLNQQELKARGVALLWLWVAALGQAHADWPQFRGPTAQGVANGKLPTQWDSKQNVVWRCELPGEGWSSPVVAGNYIYLTSAIPQDEAGYNLALLIVDADSGRLTRVVDLFVQPADAPGIHKKNSHASPTPVIDADRIYLHFGHQGTACCQLDGTVVWKNSELNYRPVHGNGGSPVVTQNRLIFSRDGGDIGQVTALEKASGRLSWQRDRDVPAQKRFSFCTPLLMKHGDREQLVIPGSDVVQSLDPDSGVELWRVHYTGYSVVPRPIYHAGLVFVSTGYDRAKLLAIDPSGQGDVTSTHVRWISDSAVPNTPSLVAWQSNIVMISDNGIASCLRAESGELVWKSRIGGDFSASPLLAENRLYLFSEAGICTILDLTTETPEIVSRNDMKERTLASPGVIDGDLLIRTAQALYRIQSPQ